MSAPAAKPTIPSAFTPGPWSYWHDTCYRCEEQGEKEFVIDGPPGGYHGQFSNEADARLIASAPRLYAALDALIQEAIHVWEYDADYLDIAEGIAALKQARGETP